ncbi:hypothetical protein N9Y42_09215 [Mariniblastus sp.]|nr:hypothetical protein [Mariniblastus sp.]
MLFALLYNHQDQVLAAAPACDQLALGDQFWLDCHGVDVRPADIFATAYREIRDPSLQQRLLKLGVDESILSSSVTHEIEAMDMGGIQRRAA